MRLDVCDPAAGDCRGSLQRLDLLGDLGGDGRRVDRQRAPPEAVAIAIRHVRADRDPRSDGGRADGAHRPGSSPAWKPHATLALVTSRSSAGSAANPSPTSAFRSTTTTATNDNVPDVAVRAGRGREPSWERWSWMPDASSEAHDPFGCALIGQCCFLALMLSCCAIQPSRLAVERGLSYYGNSGATIVPYAIGFSALIALDGARVAGDRARERRCEALSEQPSPAFSY